MVWKDPEREDEEVDEDGKRKDPPGPGMRNAGIGLTLGGLGVGVVAAVLAAGSQESHDIGTTVISMALGVVGGAMVLTGIPLWAVGAARYKSPSSSGSAAGVYLALGAGSAAVQGRF